MAKKLFLFLVSVALLGACLTAGCRSSQNGGPAPAAIAPTGIGGR